MREPLFQTSAFPLNSKKEKRKGLFAYHITTRVSLYKQTANITLVGPFACYPRCLLLLSHPCYRPPLARIKVDFLRPWNEQNQTRTTPLPPKTGEAGFKSSTGAGAFEEKK